jgi:hypothetical protein
MGKKARIKRRRAARKKKVVIEYADGEKLLLIRSTGQAKWVGFRNYLEMLGFVDACVDPQALKEGVIRSYNEKAAEKVPVKEPEVRAH